MQEDDPARLYGGASAGLVLSPLVRVAAASAAGGANPAPGQGAHRHHKKSGPGLRCTGPAGLPAPGPIDVALIPIAVDLRAHYPHYEQARPSCP